jgi:hypothetical protein
MSSNDTRDLDGDLHPTGILPPFPPEWISMHMIGVHLTVLGSSLQIHEDASSAATAEIRLVLVFPSHCCARRGPGGIAAITSGRA